MGDRLAAAAKMKATAANKNKSRQNSYQHGMAKNGVSGEIRRAWWRGMASVVWRFARIAAKVACRQRAGKTAWQRRGDACALAAKHQNGAMAAAAMAWRCASTNNAALNVSAAYARKSKAGAHRIKPRAKMAGDGRHNGIGMAHQNKRRRWRWQITSKNGAFGKMQRRSVAAVAARNRAASRNAQRRGS